MKQPAAGLRFFKAALEANPNQGQYWLSYSDALTQAGQTNAARQVLELGRKRGLLADAIAAAPVQCVPSDQEIDALAALFSVKQYAEVSAVALTMTARYPHHGFGWMALGVSLHQLGRSAEALTPLQKAAALSGNIADTHLNLGATLNALGRLSEAEASYRQALKIKRGCPEAYCALGNRLVERGRFSEAEDNFRRALEIRPNYADALSGLGNALTQGGRLTEAEASYRQALLANPDFAEGHNNLPFLPDWRWMADREDSPWYPNTRLFRQMQRGNWEEVFERVVQRLKAVIDGESPILWPPTKVPCAKSAGVAL